MELISKHTKRIMEECKSRALDDGLVFDSESLEYIVTNRDMLELSSKVMIPTMYDYWVQDLEVIKAKKEYEIYPNNAYETVINSRPALSFYNDNNPDWLNVMIFYHVLGHIDSMQNNSYYRHTWDDDFVGQALADKRLINNLRSQYGRWVDYVIEFTRGMDNLTGYFKELSHLNLPKGKEPNRIDYFFDVFLQQIKQVDIPIYLKELENYNQIQREKNKQAKSVFISKINNHYPEFESLFAKYCEDNKDKVKPNDIIQYIMQNSAFINQDENLWMQSVMEIVRNTALYFEPQRRTKILNEGWATYWHNKLFLKDDRMKSHEISFAKINAEVTALPKLGVNPYAIGFRLISHLKECADKGKLSYEFTNLTNIEERKQYNKKLATGDDFIFYMREHYCDFTALNTFVDQDFVDRYHLVVIGERVNQERQTLEYYIKSKEAEDYKRMLIDELIHPPKIVVDMEKSNAEKLCLEHVYERKQLVPEFIENTMMGIEYLWGGSVQLDTHSIEKGKPKKMRYTMKERKLMKESK